MDLLSGSRDVATTSQSGDLPTIALPTDAPATAPGTPSRLRKSTISQQHSPPVTTSQLPLSHLPVASGSKVAQIGNPAVHKLPLVEFLNEDTRPRIQPDDLADPLLMACCRALACVGNRALCPKEIADVCIKNGWNCTGSQPFAIVSTCIRGHLRRRGILTNSSNGRAATATSAPPLFASYELTGPVQPIDTLAMGIESDAKLAVKRGTLWYLSEEATGIPSPFGERDPYLPQNQTAEAIAARQPKHSLRRTSLPASMSMPSLSNRGSKQASPEEELGPNGEALGRGKRKRKASGIAGGDAEWHSGDKKGSTLETVPERSTSAPSHRRAGSIDSTFKYPASTPMTVLDRVSGIKRIKLRLNNGTNSTADSSIAESDSESNDTSSFAAAQERRRMKKRSKSDGSLLLLEPSAMHFRPPANSTSLSPVDTLDGHVRARSAEPPRSASLNDSAARRVFREDVDMQPVKDEADDELDDDFHEALLKGDLDFNFECIGRLPCALDDVPDEELALLHYDTPATSPGSPEVIGDGQELYDLANDAVNAKVPEGGEELILLGLDECKAAETLAEQADPNAASSSDEADTSLEDGLLSPAPPLPALPIVTAANTIGFAPAGGIQEIDDTDDPGSLASSFSDFGHLHEGLSSRMRRSFSPASSLDSSYSATPDSEMHSGAPSPGACSSDSFDAEVVIGAVQRRLSEELDVASPSELQYDLITAEEAHGEEDLRVSGQELAIDELDLEFGGSRDACEAGSTPPPTPFGPELYGFVKSPCMNWQPAPLVDLPICEEAQKDLSLELVSEDVEMESQATVVKTQSPAPLEGVRMITIPLEDKKFTKPVLQRKTSVPKDNEAKTPKAKAPRKAAPKVSADGTAPEPKKAVARRSARKSK